MDRELYNNGRIYALVLVIALLMEKLEQQGVLSDIANDFEFSETSNDFMGGVNDTLLRLQEMSRKNPDDKHDT